MKLFTSIAAFAAGVGIVCAAGMVTLGQQGAAAAIAKDGSRWTDAFGGDNRVIPAEALRGGKSDRLPTADCGDQAWPYVEPSCLKLAEGTIVASRTVTLEYRTPAENLSVLVRVPLVQMAAR